MEGFREEDREVRAAANGLKRVFRLEKEKRLAERQRRREAAVRSWEKRVRETPEGVCPSCRRPHESGIPCPRLDGSPGHSLAKGHAFMGNQRSIAKASSIMDPLRHLCGLKGGEKAKQLAAELVRLSLEAQSEAVRLAAIRVVMERLDPVAKRVHVDVAPMNLSFTLGPGQELPTDLKALLLSQNQDRVIDVVSETMTEAGDQQEAANEPG